MKKEDERDLFLESIKEEMENNLRFMLIASFKTEKVLSVKARSQYCDWMQHDMAKSTEDVYASLYDSKFDGADELKSVLEYVSERGMKLVGNLSWIPSFN